MRQTATGFTFALALIAVLILLGWGVRSIRGVSDEPPEPAPCFTDAPGLTCP